MLGRYYELRRFLLRIKYSIRNYFKNIWLFRDALSDSVPWDYSGLLLLMKTQITLMEESTRLFGHHSGKDKHCKRMRECVFLLDRLLEEDYFKGDIVSVKNGNLFTTKIVPLYDYPQNPKVISQLDSLQKKRDVGRLFYLMDKYMFCWWD